MSDSRLFSRKNCLVLGATQPVGQLMSTRLAARGAFVVAVDRDEEALFELARNNPERIAPLTLDPADEQALKRLTSNWGPDPLHALICAQGLDEQMSLSDLLKSVDVATRKLAPILEASHGAALLLCPGVESDDNALQHASARALATLVSGLAADGARINALALHEAARAPKAAAKLCATAMMLLLPMSASISGAVLPIGQHGMPA